ncbi:MAG: hypothetical protein OR996_01920 [Phycisphaerales bacterium]|nr:hypothetical protein [Phycisphaerales bacterium]
MNSPEISLPFGRLVAAQSAAVVLAGLLWTSGVFIAGYPSEYILWGLSEIVAIWVISLATLVLFSPGKSRPIATIGTLWSATSFIRFLVALIASTLLYYVAQFGLRPLMFSFLLTAVFLLIAETKVLANSLAEYSKSTNV